jgi:hypothetical protein
MHYAEVVRPDAVWKNRSILSKIAQNGALLSKISFLAEITDQSMVV